MQFKMNTKTLNLPQVSKCFTVIEKLSLLRDELLHILLNCWVIIKKAKVCINESELNIAVEKKEGYGKR